MDHHISRSKQQRNMYVLPFIRSPSKFSPQRHNLLRKDTNGQTCPSAVDGFCYSHFLRLPSIDLRPMPIPSPQGNTLYYIYFIFKVTKHQTWHSPPPYFTIWAILVNMEISVTLGHEKTKIQNLLDLGKIDVISVRTIIHIKNKMMGHLI